MFPSSPEIKIKNVFPIQGNLSYCFSQMQLLGDEHTASISNVNGAPKHVCAMYFHSFVFVGNWVIDFSI